MVSLEVCKKILNKRNNKYSEEEIKLIRDYLYFLAELQIENNNKEN
ncbi:hypothetical protein M2451_004107 [Dysgonomonas sp. PFB1-18]|nr:hypothetical protein [Dysgonomonas sp. PF1-14]MDH6341060.1 hypothetical protein [Dysgonomonas sp. PF1-16]MDH6382757.1 hypothetical protein [Dysgonomonas sp. PFB1-18]MDH6400048.1 hypothetical protein [Dysgonomonas sp. PF1-23]